MMLLQSVLNVEKQISQSVTFIHALSVCKNNSTKASTKNSYTVVAQYQFFTFLLFTVILNMWLSW